MNVSWYGSSEWEEGCEEWGASQGGGRETEEIIMGDSDWEPILILYYFSCLDIVDIHTII